ncbi:aspartic proteinase CDR1-like [Senna tora]|uniref:Aspartic proteinase CDR1-like n=1 Tax=Senna tora TaxID=362788 RepID=A0A835CCX4_9FABA|nr:aspartic proteinase CDR1-like [Senna tora]
MASPLHFLLCIFFLSCSIFMPSSKSHSTNPFNGGFAISLIHRDSPQSPFYNHSMTTYDRHLAAAHRSIRRLNWLLLRAASQNDPPDISSEIFFSANEYIMTFYIGNPPVKINAFADSGSDLIWTKALPYFDPSKSFSYTNLSCGHASCTELGPERKTCSKTDDPCTYKLTYADESTTSGVVATDKFTFEAPDGSLVDVGFLEFGYSYVSSPDFPGMQNGCVGLNREHFSLVNQLGIKRFSHCMAIPDAGGSGNGRMHFGSMAPILGDTTPILMDKPWHYYVTLESISIGDQQVPFRQGVFNVARNNDEGFVIDSGTSNTLLREDVYEIFLFIMTLRVPFPVTKMLYFDLCFHGSYQDLSSIPFVTFHFTGANVRLLKENTFLEVGGGFWCLGILKSEGDLSIFGSMQMRNLWGQADC